MKASRTCPFAASHQFVDGGPVAGRWQCHVNGATDLYRPHVRSSSSPLIRHSDELQCRSGSLQDVEFGRAHG